MPDGQQHITPQNAARSNLAPTMSHLALSQQPEPGQTNITIPVPQATVRAGHDTTTAQDSPDSPMEWLDQGITRETDKEAIEPTHPATDSATNIDPHEEYDEGQSGAAEATEPNAGDAVVGYDPHRDQRSQAT